MFRRSEVYYCEDRTTGQQKSLRTRDEAEAERIIQAKNDAVKLPQMNLVMAKTYLAAQDPKMISSPRKRRFEPTFWRNDFISNKLFCCAHVSA